MNNYGEHLKNARIKAGLKLYVAAKNLDITSASLMNYERGKTEPRISMLIEMSRLYETTLEKLIGIGK